MNIIRLILIFVFLTYAQLAYSQSPYDLAVASEHEDITREVISSCHTMANCPFGTEVDSIPVLGTSPLSCWDSNIFYSPGATGSVQTYKRYTYTCKVNNPLIEIKSVSFRWCPPEYLLHGGIFDSYSTAYADITGHTNSTGLTKSAGIQFAKLMANQCTRDYSSSEPLRVSAITANELHLEYIRNFAENNPFFDQTIFSLGKSSLGTQGNKEYFVFMRCAATSTRESTLSQLGIFLADKTGAIKGSDKMCSTSNCTSGYQINSDGSPSAASKSRLEDKLFEQYAFCKKAHGDDGTGDDGTGDDGTGDGTGTGDDGDTNVGVGVGIALTKCLALICLSPEFEMEFDIGGIDWGGGDCDAASYPRQTPEGTDYCCKPDNGDHLTLEYCAIPKNSDGDGSGGSSDGTGDDSSGSGSGSSGSGTSGSSGDLKKIADMLEDILDSLTDTLSDHDCGDPVDTPSCGSLDASKETDTFFNHSNADGDYIADCADSVQSCQNSIYYQAMGCHVVYDKFYPYVCLGASCFNHYKCDMEAVKPCSDGETAQQQASKNQQMCQKAKEEFGDDEDMEEVCKRNFYLDWERCKEWKEEKDAAADGGGGFDDSDAESVGKSVGENLQDDFESIVAAIRDMRDTLKREIDDIGEDVAAALEDELNNIQSLLEQANDELKQITTSINDLRDLLEQINDSIVALNESVKGLEDSIEQVGEDVAVALRPQLDNLRNTINQVGDDITEAIDYIGEDVAENLRQDFEALREAIEDVDESVDELRPYLVRIEEAIGRVGNDVDEALSDEFETLTRAIKDLEFCGTTPETACYTDIEQNAIKLHPKLDDLDDDYVAQREKLYQKFDSVEDSLEEFGKKGLDDNIEVDDFLLPLKDWSTSLLKVFPSASFPKSDDCDLTFKFQGATFGKGLCNSDKLGLVKIILEWIIALFTGVQLFRILNQTIEKSTLIK